MSQQCDHTDDERYKIYDGYGIFLAYVCTRCEDQVRSKFRPDIDTHYECDEPIEPEEY